MRARALMPPRLGLGTLAALPPTAQASLALSVAPGGRYLQTSNGTPFFINGEAAWLIMVLSLADIAAFLDNCVAMGINVIRVMGPFYSPGGGPLPNNNGDYPFATPADFTTAFVDAWWTYFKAMLALAASRNIRVSIAVLYYGYGGAEWGAVMSGKTAVEHQTYGAALATRLLGHSNIIYEAWGDSIPPEPTRTSALVAGLRSVSPDVLVTAQPNRGVNSDSQQPSGGNWDINFVYAWSDSYVKSLDGWNANVGPCWLGEPYYEWRLDPTITLLQLRSQRWWAATSGVVSYLYGNERIYNFDWPAAEAAQNYPGSLATSYWEAYNDPGRLQNKTTADFLRSIQWWRLVPDTGSSLLSSARGSGFSYVTVAKSSGPQDLALFYLPSGGTHTVVLSGFSGPVTVRRIDPASGASTTVGSYAASGSQSFDASAWGNNSAGDADWVMVIQS